MRRASRRVVTGLLLVVLCAPASACGSGDDGTSDGLSVPSTTPSDTAAAGEDDGATDTGVERTPPPSSPAVGGSVRLVVDTDLAADDIVALAYLVSDPRVDLLAVSVSGTGEVSCPQGTDVATAVLAALGRPDVPVACGTSQPVSGDRAFPTEWREAADNAWDLELPSPLVSAGDADVDADAVALLIDQISSAPGSVTLLTLGPLTNVAIALSERPDLTANIDRVVMMGGAVDVPGNVQLDGASTPLDAEWNFYVDPEAAAAVVTSGAPVTLVSLDATNQVPVTHDALATLAANDTTDATAMVMQLFERFPPPYLWDPLAAVAVTDPDLLGTREVAVSVVTDGDDAGRTAETADGTIVEVLVGPDDPEVIVTHLLRILAGVTEDELVAPTIAPPTTVVVVDELTLSFDGTTCTFDGATTLQQGYYSITLAPGPEQYWGSVVHLVGDATVDETLAWIDSHPQEQPPMIDTAAQIGEGVLESPGVVEFLPGTVAVGCITADDSIHVAASVTVNP